MKVYVAGALADVERVRGVQAAVVGVGHELTLDWTLGPDASLVDYALAPEVAGRLASDDLDAVLAADAVLVVLSEHEGRGMFVELGAALARAVAGDLEHLVVVGATRHDSVLLLPPCGHPGGRRRRVAEQPPLRMPGARPGSATSLRKRRVPAPVPPTSSRACGGRVTCV